jgi:DnaJ homolog subfamily B member 11
MVVDVSFRSSRAVFASFLCISVFAIICCAAQDRDLYEILGVPRSSSQTQIRKAYRKLIKENHPDRYQDAEEKVVAKQKFSEISQAYDVLSNADKRAAYNREGMDGVRRVESQGRGGGAGTGNPFFDSVFNMFDPFGRGQKSEMHGDEEFEHKKGPSVEMTVEVDLKGLYNGKEMQLVRDRQIAVMEDGFVDCRCRQELHFVPVGPGRMQTQPKKICDKCQKFTFHHDEDDRLFVDIEPGMHTGSRIVLSQQSDPFVDGVPGDVVIVIQEREDSEFGFQRDGNDLHIEVGVPLREALIGFRREIEHLDGHMVLIDREDQISSPGMVMRIQGEGMPLEEDNMTFGDLFVKIKVIMPQHISQEQKDIIRDLFP